jgi:post-segregation antitoxin (ccd killing protein)
MATPTNTESNILLKKQLLEAARKKQLDIANDAQSAMNEAQAGANEEKGSMEEKFESFRTQLQQDRDMYAKQFVEAKDKLEILSRISDEKINFSVDLGAVVITDANQKFYISISLAELKIDDKPSSYFAISTAAPIYENMNRKKKGESFEFRGKMIKIIDLF